MVSFGSNYRFNIGANFPYKVMNKLESFNDGEITIKEKYTPFDEASKTGVFAKVAVSAPDYFDSKIETLLISKGIDFHKQTFSDAMDLDNIKNRIQLSGHDAGYGFSLIDVDTEILDNLLKEDGASYIEPNGRNGISNRYQCVGKYLQTGENIDATKVYLQECDGKLTATIGDGRHRFAYMRDIGMESIPISVDKNSYNLAVKYGLINEN